MRGGEGILDNTRCWQMLLNNIITLIALSFVWFLVTVAYFYSFANFLVDFLTLLLLLLIFNNWFLSVVINF